VAQLTVLANGFEPLLAGLLALVAPKAGSALRALANRADLISACPISTRLRTRFGTRRHVDQFTVFDAGGPAFARGPLFACFLAFFAGFLTLGTSLLAIRSVHPLSNRRRSRD
jgi:hypothetical protein